MSKPKHILVIRFSAMGDVAMTVPVIRAVTQYYPSLKITVVTRPFFKPFFRDLPNVGVYTADLNQKHKGLYGLYKLTQELKALKIDAVADLHNVLRTKVLKVFCFGLPFLQLDKGRKDKKALISGKIFQQLKTTHQRYAEVFEQLGYPVELSNPSFPKPNTLPDKMKQRLERHQGALIGIAPFAAHSSKMYPLDKMKAVIEALSKQHTILLFGGGEKESSVLNDFEKTFENTINVAGQLTLEEELDLISNSELMVSMDSGNGHLAAMLGVKVLTLWGITHPYAGFAPFNQPEHYALTADREQFPLIPTSVYGNTYPDGYEQAAGSIPVADIVDKVTRLLAKSDVR